MKISKELTDAVANGIRQGHSNRFACATVGVSDVNYYRWRKRGKAILEMGRCAKLNDKAYLYFYQETEKAHADYALKLIEPVEKVKHWRRLLGYLNAGIENFSGDLQFGAFM